MSSLPQDENGYAIPWAGDDAVIECAACDPLGGQPEDWPECEWIDGNRYALGPDPDQTTDEPAEEDIMKFLARCHERERHCWEDLPTGGCCGHPAVEPGID